MPQSTNPIVARNGRFFIAMGFAGFNLAANQVRGYATEQAALKAHMRLVRR